MFSSLKVLELLFLMQHSILVSVRGSVAFLIRKGLTKVNSVRDVSNYSERDSIMAIKQCAFILIRVRLY